MAADWCSLVQMGNLKDKTQLSKKGLNLKQRERKCVRQQSFSCLSDTPWTRQWHVEVDFPWCTYTNHFRKIKF